MERTESLKSSAELLDSNSIANISKWLPENLQDMQETSEQVMKAIEDGNSSTREIDDFNLKNLVQEFSSVSQSLAEHIDGESQQASLHLELQMGTEESLQSDSYQGSPHATPELKLQSHNLDHHNVCADFSSSSGDGSFGPSLKEGTESSSLSSDSESEYFTSTINSYLDSVKQISGPGQQQKKSKPSIQPISMNLSSEEVDMDESDNAKRSGYGSYEELISRIEQYEGDIKVLNLKLQQSEEEVTMLKSALSRSDAAALDLQVQLEATKTQMDKKDVNLEEAKGKILHIENQMLELEAHIADSHCKTEVLIQELKQAQEKLERSNEDAAMLTAELDIERQRVVELQKMISKYQEDVSDRENEIARLQSAQSESERKHFMEKEQLIIQWESQCKQLEENWRQHGDELKELHHALVRDMQDHISNSQVAIEERESRIDRLNKELDRLKLRHDMVVAEKDELNARVQNLFAELSCRDDQIKELTAEVAGAHEIASKLKSRVQELEKEVEMQKVLISDSAEKKREAIRQLCFSLEHYRTGYQELREAFRGHSKRRTVLAS